MNKHVFKTSNGVEVELNEDDMHAVHQHYIEQCTADYLREEKGQLILFATNKKTIVYQWELDVTRKWSTEELKNRIWQNKECGQPIPGCVSREALRIELTLRGDQPNGYHEDIADVDMSNIEIEQPYSVHRKKGR